MAETANTGVPLAVRRVAPPRAGAALALAVAGPVLAVLVIHY